MGGGWGEQSEVRGIPDRSLVEGLAMRGGVEQVVLRVRGNYGTGRRGVTWSIFKLRSIVHGRLVFISMGNFAGLRCGEEKSMPEVGSRRLSQGSRIRTRSRGESGRVETQSSEN